VIQQCNCSSIKNIAVTLEYFFILKINNENKSHFLFPAFLVCDVLLSNDVEASALTQRAEAAFDLLKKSKRLFWDVEPRRLRAALLVT